jgi:hypothetical protein
MNENVENLVLEHLRAIRADMVRLADSMRTMQSEMSAMRQHLAGVVTLQEHDHGDIAALKSRVDRIEKRLDLVE